MRVLLNVNGRSQYSSDVRPEYQNSACGPTTAHVILNYLSKDDETLLTKDINELYKLLGGTKRRIYELSRLLTS